MSEQNYSSHTSHISHQTGYSGNHLVKTNYENFEKGAIVETIGSVMKQGIGHDFEVLEPKQLHTLVKSTLHLAGNQANLTPLKFVSSSEMKVARGVPVAASMAGDRQHLLQVLTPYNSMWDTLEDLKNAIIEHVSKVKDEILRPSHESQPNTQAEPKNTELKCPATVFPNAMFQALGAQTTGRNGEGKDWEVRSQYGTLRLSAKSIARLHSSTELDWDRQIENVQACSQAMGDDGIQLVRHKLIARNVKGDTYVLDNVYLPCSPHADHSLGIFVVTTGNLRQQQRVTRTGVEGLPASVVEDASCNLKRSYVSIPKSLFHEVHGSFRYDIVRLHAPKMLEMMNDLANTHMVSQVYKAVLKLRPSLGESAKRLTAQQKGRWLRSPALLRTYHNLLKAELTPQELQQSEAWLAGAMRANPNTLKCSDASMFKNAAKGSFEIGSVSSEFDMRFNFEGEFGRRRLEVRLRNPWRLQSHGLIIY